MKLKFIPLFALSLLLLTACAHPSSDTPSRQTSESLTYYGHYLVGEEDIDEFSEIIRNNDIDYDYEHKLQTPGDTNGGMAISAGEYAVLWKAEMEAQYEKLYSLLSEYVQSGEISETRLMELSDAQTAFLAYLQNDMMFVQNTLGPVGEMQEMGSFGTVMINSRYASAYRQRTIDLMEYIYLLDHSALQFVYQNDYRH